MLSRFRWKTNKPTKQAQKELHGLELRNKILSRFNIGFKVNFIEDTMKIFYNPQRLDVLWKNIPKCFTIVMCSYRDKKYDVQITRAQRLDNFNNAIDYSTN